MAICPWVVTAGIVVHLTITTLQDTTTDTPYSTTSMMEATLLMSTTTIQDPSASTSAETDASTSTSPETRTQTPPPTSPMTTPSGRCRLSRECGRGAFCIMSRCTCAYGSYRLGTQCVPSIPVGGNCSNDTRCMAPSTCNYSVCTCPGDYYQKDQQCEARVQVGGRCNNNSECVVNVDCINNTCTCQADLFFKDGKCIPRVSPGEDCSNSTCVENAECKSSTCQCKHGFMINGSFCTIKEKRRVEKLVVSGQTSSSVLVAFDGHLDYNTFRIDYNSSDPPKCVVLRRNSSQEVCSECLQVEDVKPSTDLHIEYNVTGLKPFTTYDIKVVMEKCNNGSLETSRPAHITAQTTSAVPNAVKDLTTCTNKRCLVCAKWKPPVPYPGPVTYRVEIFDEVNRIVAKASNINTTSICYTKEDVNYFLKYSLWVTAFTSAGKGNQSSLTSIEIHFLEFTIVTAEGECNKSPSPKSPGDQSNNDGNYRQMTIEWSEPQIGTPITSYILVTNGEKRNITSNGAGPGYNVPIVVTPGSKNTFKIQVRHNGTLYNVSPTSSCHAPIGVPPEWPHDLQPSFEVTDNSIEIKRIDFFNNSKNGAITEGLLFISTKKETLEVPDHQSGDVRATKIECCNGGFIKDCTAGYCKRGLAPDTEYYYRAVACTKRGCRPSPVFQFRTFKGVSPGEDCSNSTCVENAECKSSTCQCKHGFMINGSFCTIKEKRRVEKLVVSGQTSSSVLVAFDGHLDYNTFRIDYNSSDPPKCVVLRRNSSQEVCSECLQVEDVKPSTDLHIEYNVTGLKPFTTYDIKVVMEKCNNGSLETSRPAHITAQTTSAVPNAVKDLTTCTNKRCLVCAKWKPPVPYPGPVTYRVEIFDEVNRIVAKASNINTTSICYTKEDVNYFLKYSLWVTAFTSAGKGNQSSLTSIEIHFLEFTIVTAEGECNKSPSPKSPGDQSNNDGNYRQMTIEWSEPQIGTPITSYILVTNGEKRNITSNGAGPGYNVPIVVTPGSKNTFKIQVRHNGTLYNVSPTSSCHAPIGVPPEWPHDLQPSFEVTDNSIEIKRIDFFNNSKNGAITEGLLFISTKKETLEVPDHQSGDVRATKIECCNGGFIKDCTAGYCKRGLAPDTEYYYRAVACTKRGCRPSPVFQFRTFKDNTNAIVIGMLVTCIIVAATIIAAALLSRSKNRNTHNHHRHVPDDRDRYTVRYRRDDINPQNGYDSINPYYLSPAVDRQGRDVPEGEYEELHVYEEVK